MSVKDTAIEKSLAEVEVVHFISGTVLTQRIYIPNMQVASVLAALRKGQHPEFGWGFINPAGLVTVRVVDPRARLPIPAG